MMKDDLKDLKNDVLNLFMLFNFYKEVFRNENEDVLNKYPYFFFVIYYSLFNSIIIKIAKLLDPQKQGKKENLALELFCNDDKEIKENFNSLIENSKKLKDIRNKLIAHKDINWKEISKENQLHIREIEAVLSNIETLMNSLGKKYGIWNNLEFKRAGYIEMVPELRSILKILNENS